MITAPTSRVVTPQDVPHTCWTRLVARLEGDVERLGEVLTEVVRRAGLQRAAVAHQRLDRVGAQRAGELLALGSSCPSSPASRAPTRRPPCRDRGSSASLLRPRPRFRAPCALPARGTRSCAGTDSVTFSQRTTFAHWLIRIGRSRHDCTHFAYIVPMIASEVGRTTSFSSSSSPPRVRDIRDLRREAFDVLGFLGQQAVGDEQRKVRVDVSGRLDPRVERLLDQLPDRVAVRPDDHAALDRRVVGQLGSPHDVEIPAREILRTGCDFGDETCRSFLAISDPRSR